MEKGEYLTCFLVLLILADQRDLHVRLRLQELYLVHPLLDTSVKGPSS